MKQFEKALAKNGIYQKTDKYLIAQIEKAVRDWLAGKLIVGSEKANAYNEVILKLLHELDIQQEKENKNE